MWTTISPKSKCSSARRHAPILDLDQYSDASLSALMAYLLSELHYATRSRIRTYEKHSQSSSAIPRDVRPDSQKPPGQEESDDTSPTNKTVGKFHSITSSARASTVGGRSMPSALAALRLMTSSRLTGSCTGRSAGAAPLRIRST